MSCASDDFRGGRVFRFPGRAAHHENYTALSYSRVDVLTMGALH